MSRKKKIRPLDLSKAVDELLKEYGEQVFDVLSGTIEDVSKEAVQDLRSVSTFSPSGNPTGAYSKSWTYEQRMTGRIGTESVVFNEDHYQLTHLLESGHAKYLWGRPTGETVQGYPHISKVNDEVQEKLIEEIGRRINDL